MPDIFRKTLRDREQNAGLRDVNEQKWKGEQPAGSLTQQEFSNAGKEDPRKKNLAQRDKLLKERSK